MDAMTNWSPSPKEINDDLLRAGTAIVLCTNAAESLQGGASRYPAVLALQSDLNHCSVMECLLTRFNEKLARCVRGNFSSIVDAREEFADGVAYAALLFAEIYKTKGG